MVKVEGIVADAARVVGAFLLCAAGIGCGGGGGGTGSGPGSSTRGPGMGDPPAPSVTLQGGSATAAGGQGKTGGAAHLVSSGAITIGPDFQPPAASPPGNAMAVAASDLSSDVQAPGSVSISGTQSSGGTDAVRTITAGGDIFISGTLRGADLGGARQGLALKASGTVYVTGSIDTSGADGSGQGGGPVTIMAQQVIVSGKLLTHGGDGSSTGGDGGSVTIDSSGTVAVTGTFDMRGGSATGGSAATGGAAGALKVGETTRPSAIGLTVPLVTKGGDGQASGGDGGTVALEAHGGDLRVSGVVDASGGDSATKPGAGGAVNGNPGPEGSSAGIDIAGQVASNGGSITKGGAGNGASGGIIKLVVLAPDGKGTIEPTGQVQADGGSSAGAGTAGGGGLIYLFTNHADVSIHGKMLARGGADNDPGGTGGGGGFVYVFTGNFHDRMSGILIVETDGVIDTSGGDGTVGGSARNDGKAGSVALFPVKQDDEYDVEQVAVLINSDGVHGSDRGWIDNRGQIFARGGKVNGNGGDVIFHGKRQDGNETPIPDNVVDSSGDGTGKSGDFAGE